MALNTEKCNAWVERDKKVFAPTQHLSYYPMVIKKVDQDVIYDEDDNQYIDFLSSASSLNLGSCNPIITAAVKEQLDNYSQYTIAYTYGRKSIEYAERLTSVYPGGVPAKIVFGNCGSDANDAAVKFARAYTGRRHGNTGAQAHRGCRDKHQGTEAGACSGKGRALHDAGSGDGRLGVCGCVPECGYRIYPRLGES